MWTVGLGGGDDARSGPATQFCAWSCEQHNCRHRPWRWRRSRVSLRCTCPARHDNRSEAEPRGASEHNVGNSGASELKSATALVLPEVRRRTFGHNSRIAQALEFSLVPSPHLSSSLNPPHPSLSISPPPFLYSSRPHYALTSSVSRLALAMVFFLRDFSSAAERERRRASHCKYWRACTHAKAPRFTSPPPGPATSITAIMQTSPHSNTPTNPRTCSQHTASGR